MWIEDRFTEIIVFTYISRINDTNVGTTKALKHVSSTAVVRPKRRP
jgi:hypothetical protein